MVPNKVFDIKNGELHKNKSHPFVPPDTCQLQQGSLGFIYPHQTHTLTCGNLRSSSSVPIWADITHDDPVSAATDLLSLLQV
jgi:hypothetical protein